MNTSDKVIPDELLFSESSELGTGICQPEQDICDNCPGCLVYCRYEPLPNEDGFFRLINAMVSELLSLEEEVVRCRQALSIHLTARWAEGLRQDMFCGLSARFTGDFEEYDRFVNEYFYGQDPMENEEHSRKMWDIINGIDESCYRHLW